MNLGQAPQSSLALLTNESLLELPMRTRLLALALIDRAAPRTNARLNPKVIKGRYFPMDDEMTVDAIEEGVLQLDAVEFLTLWGDADNGGEQYVLEPPFAAMVGRDRATASTPDADASPQSGFIGSGKERARARREESESERDEATPARSSRAPLPSPFCPEHRPYGSHGKPCVVCRDYRHVFVKEIKDRSDEHYDEA